MEVTRGYEKLVSALDVWQQQILRKCGPFVRPTTSKASKPQGGKPTNTVSSGTCMDKKKRSKGSDRKSLGLPPHTAPPSFKNQPSTTSMPALATPLVRFSTMDTRKKYRQEAQRQLKNYEPGTIEELPCSLLREKQRKLPLNRSGHKGDLRDHLAKKQQIFLH